MKIDLTVPKTCGECKHIGHYNKGPYARHPHCCCELIWRLCEEEHRVKEESLYKNCPLKKLTISED